MAPSENWDRLSESWDRALRDAGVEMFHMTDFEADRGEFADWKAKRPLDRRVLLDALLDLIIEHVPALVGFVASPAETDGTFRGTYRKGIVDTITLLAREARHADGDPLALVFAKHPQYPVATIEKHFGSIGQDDPRLRTIAIQEPMGTPPLQAADIVAYELSRVQRPGREERYPFRRLKEGAKRFTLEHRA